jgi:phenylalanyl-tRNA synthetase beta chain
MMQGTQSDRQTFIDSIKRVLVSLGMTEELSFSFTSPEALDKLCVPEDSELRKAVPIMNPLTDEYPLVRTTLLTSIMENAVRNFSRKNMNLRLFDVAPVFSPKALPVTELPNEVVKLVGLISGRRYEALWNQPHDMVDFYDMKGIVEQLLAALSISKYTVEAGEHYAMHPGKTAVFKKGREVIAAVGELHPQAAENYGIKQPVYIFEMDVETLMKYTAKSFKYESLPKCPAISRDLAMLVDDEVQAADIEKVISKNGGKYFQGVTLFDVYTGKQVAEGKKSMAFNLMFQSKDKTLTDEEADSAFKNILQAVEREFQAELRA